MIVGASSNWFFKPTPALNNPNSLLSVSRDRRTVMDEEQFVLRLPPPLAERMRLALSSKAKRDAAGGSGKFSISFSDPRTATFTLDGDVYPASLMDLPCIVETHKTADKRTYYKSGDVHQALVVRMPGEDAPGIGMESGVTAGSTRARERFATASPVFSADQVESVENQMKYVVDNKVQFVRKKQEPVLPVEEEEVVIEEEAGGEAAPVAPADVNIGASGNGNAPKEEAKAVKEGSAADAASAAPEDSVGMAADSASIPAASPSAMETPGPEEDEEDDDFAAMMAAEMMDDDGGAEREADEAKRRIERANLDKKIEEVKAAIAKQESQAAAAPNQVLRQRILNKRNEMQAKLTELEASRAALDNPCLESVWAKAA